MTQVRKLPPGSVESTLEGLTVVVREKDGYIDATRLCKDHGKEFKNWHRLDYNVEFLQDLKDSTQADYIEVIMTGDNTERGTWVHPKVAVEIVRWIKRNTRQRPLGGFVYLVTFPGSSRIKIGMWTSELRRLFSRYATVYGNDLQLDYWQCKDVRSVEQKVHREMQNFHLSGELFSRDAEEMARTVLHQLTGSTGERWVVE